MSKIAGVLHLERRRRQRYAVELRVQFSLNGRAQTGLAVDISDEGMRLQSEADLDERAQLIVHFARPGTTAVQRLEATVQWSRPSEEVLGMFECGLHFGKLTPASRAALDALIQATRRVSEEQEIPLIADDEVTDVAEQSPPEEADPFSPEALRAAMLADTKQRESDRLAGTSALETGRAHMNAGRLNEAAAALEKAVRLLPDSPETLEALGEVKYLQGDVAQAATLLDRALRIRNE